jgi:predicted GIY-YIG superfamily endonuclease
MSAVKPSESARGPSAAGKGAARKPWKKKTPVEIVLAETDKLRQDIVRREEELKDLRRQLQKFEEARKIFET